MWWLHALQYFVHRALTNCCFQLRKLEIASLMTNKMHIWKSMVHFKVFKLSVYKLVSLQTHSTYSVWVLKYYLHVIVYWCLCPVLDFHKQRKQWVFPSNSLKFQLDPYTTDEYILTGVHFFTDCDRTWNLEIIWLSWKLISMCEYIGTSCKILMTSNFLCNLLQEPFLNFFLTPVLYSLHPTFFLHLYACIHICYSIGNIEQSRFPTIFPCSHAEQQIFYGITVSILYMQIVAYSKRVYICCQKSIVFPRHITPKSIEIFDVVDVVDVVDVGCGYVRLQGLVFWKIQET